jgi:CTP synthase
MEISERHRHRYEVNNTLRGGLEKAGVEFSGLSPDGELVEMIEYTDHPWFVGCQFHPEFKSSPAQPHPLFRGFIKAVLNERIGAAKKTKKSKKRAESRPGGKRTAL